MSSRLELPCPSRPSKDGAAMLPPTSPEGPPMTCIRLPRHRTPLGGAVETNWPWTRPASTRPLTSGPSPADSECPAAAKTLPPSHPHSKQQPAPAHSSTEFPTTQTSLDSFALGPVPRVPRHWLEHSHGCNLADGVGPPRDNTPLAQPDLQTREGHLTTAGCSSHSPCCLHLWLRSILATM